MQPRVIAVLVVRNGGKHVGRTLDALAAQTRPADLLLAVDAGSTDDSAEQLDRASAAVQRIGTPALPFGEAAALGIRTTPPAESSDDWVWLLAADTAPAPDALAELLAAVEIAPSVAVAGPKVVDPDDPALLLSFGETMSLRGAAVPLVDRELDQAQHDRDDDVLGVTQTGMLVRRTVWDRLGGFDPGLPSRDAGLDLSVRARLAGHRVVRVAAARVARVSPVEDFGRRRRSTSRIRRRIGRAAQVHRRLVYAPAAAVPLHWLSLLPLAVLRSLGHLLAKRPTAVPGEFATALVAMFPRRVPAARRRLRAARDVEWSAIAPLRIADAPLRERRAAARERAAETREMEAPLARAEFFADGGVWVVVLAGLISLLGFWRLLGAAALEGGALQPFPAAVGELWTSVLSGWRDIGVGLEGPADPFALVLAVIGTLAFWSPSAAVVVLWLIALPLAALGAWWCASRLSDRAWPPAVAAMLWALAPPLLAALDQGRIGPVVAHLALPWLVLAAIEGRRSWSAAATASLLFAVVVACAPSLGPALLVAWLAWLAAHPRSVLRLAIVPLPALALFLPLAISQLLRGTPLALLADPGPPMGFPAASGSELLLGQPVPDASGWAGLASSLGAPAAAGGALAALLVAPVALLALGAVFLPGARRAIPAVAVALLGLVAAGMALGLQLTARGSDAVAVWPGSALSLYWLGLTGAAIVGVHALRRAGFVAGLVAVICIGAAAAPAIGSAFLGSTAAQAGDGRTLPATVVAEAASAPSVRSLVLTAESDGSLLAAAERGRGETLDDQSTLAASRERIAGEERELAEFAGNLASRSGRDPAVGLDRFGISFVVLPPAATEPTDAARATRARVIEALDGTAVLQSVGETPSGSTLWRSTAVEPVAAPRIAPDGALTLLQAVVLGAAVLLALPTRRRRRVVRAETLPGEDPAETFAEDDDA